METIVNETHGAGWLAPAAYLSMAGIGASLAALLALHVASSEFAPSWRMVSEYANGQHKWLLTVVFVGWALSSFALIAALWPIHETTLGKIGLILLFLAGVGQTMGAVFDINHKLHGPAAMIGIPSLCIASILITLALAQRSDIFTPPVWVAHLPWITFVVMIGAVVLFFASLKAAGVDMSGQTGPLKELPAGVDGYVGWANRALFAATYLWAVLTSFAVIQSAAR